MLEEQDIQAVQKLNDAFRQVTAELSKVIVGQQRVVEELLVALFARGHCLLVGVPGPGGSGGRQVGQAGGDRVLGSRDPDTGAAVPLGGGRRNGQGGREQQGCDGETAKHEALFSIGNVTPRNLGTAGHRG